MFTGFFKWLGQGKRGIHPALDATPEGMVGKPQFNSPSSYCSCFSFECNHVTTGLKTTKRSLLPFVWLSKGNLNAHPPSNSTLEILVRNSQPISPSNHRHSLSSEGKHLSGGIDSSFDGRRHPHGSGYGISERHIGDENPSVQGEVFDCVSFSPLCQRQSFPIVLKQNVGVHVSGLLFSRCPTHIPRFVSLGPVNTIYRMFHRGARRHILNKQFVAMPALTNGHWISNAPAVQMPVFECRINASTNHVPPNTPKRVFGYKIDHTFSFTGNAPSSIGVALRTVDILRSKPMSIPAMSSVSVHKLHHNTPSRGCK